ncbi:hypothetical protein I3843_15G123500 [Carya illinoinensis]|uniref:Uncharacterized protein n=1 Tax=Carya illinoinensis TaxID=32201 RepID=A0A922DBH2_CARIL|nr:hypothetical protein I3760_15G126700 [Carya illinoinensis]KAG6675895.1 hypothetical protein I3842_15G128700 [Carya illinoinensis]KAG7944816.1 hypothetical protein I3843_15G123500 [Carya illinoinensis]
MLPSPSSPTISSVSSSDLDTESTGSFFHDRSTTLGTLMGVSFPAITFRAPSQHRDPQTSVSVSVSAVSRRTKKLRKNKNNFLEVERRFGDGAFFGAAAAELEGVVALQQQHQQRNGNGRLLFADGRVLPPAADGDDGASTAGSLCRFPVSLSGICSGGAG